MQVVKQSCEKDKCEGQQCSNQKNIISYRDLVDAKQLSSFDLTHKNNFDFKRFDMIPDTTRTITNQIRSNEQVQKQDLDYFYEQ